MKASNKTIYSRYVGMLVVVLLVISSGMTYMFIQSSDNELDKSTSMQPVQQVAINDVVHESINVAEENKKESNIELYQQTLETVKENIGPVTHEDKIENQYASLKSADESTVSPSSYYKNDEEQVYAYTQPEKELYEPEFTSATTAKKSYKEYFKGHSIVVGSKINDYNDADEGDNDYVIPIAEKDRDNPQEEIVDEGKAPLYHASVTREVGNFDGNSVDVVLSINVSDSPPSGMVIQEYIPKGWSLESSDPKPKINGSNGELKWLIIGKLRETRVFTYRVVRTLSPEYETMFTGFLKFNDGNSYVESPINGERKI